MRLSPTILISGVTIAIAITALVAGFVRGTPEPVTILQAPRVVSFPAATPAPAPPDVSIAAVDVVEHVTVVETFASYLDDLDRRFEEQDALDIGPIIEASEAAERARGQYIPTLEDPISPAFSESQLAGRWLSPDELRLIMILAGWPEEELDQAYRVARCESPASLSGGPSGWLDVIAIGPGLERGVFQFIPAWFAPEAAAAAGLNRALFAEFDLFDPLQNAIAALVLWRNGGWAHWECFNQGRA